MNYTFRYDHAGRLIETTHKLNNYPVVSIARNGYDKLGRLLSSKANGIGRLQTSYNYNVRSWIEYMWNSLYEEGLYYTQPPNEGTPAYNGNISAVGHAYEGFMAYFSAFTYDGLSRLKTNHYSDYYFTGPGLVNYSSLYSYDLNGNITNLSRFRVGSQLVDDMYFTYKGNQHTNILENSDKAEGFISYLKNNIQTHYTYNANGAMTGDKHKGITMTYDSYSGMPKKVFVSNSLANGVINYTYTASGRKLKAKYEWNVPVSISPLSGSIAPMSIGIGAGVGDLPPIGWIDPYPNKKTVYYADNLVYHGDTLKRIMIDNGYIENKKYYFYTKDHLGNIRVVADASGRMVQRTDYYPFGMPTMLSSEEGVQPYKYGGKEYDTMNGLNLYDFHARQYDPAVGRFTSIDPMAEMYYSISPYAYCDNNPLKFIDPTGMSIYTTTDPGNIATIYSYLANGGNLNSFDTSGWTEIPDPFSNLLASTKGGGTSLGEYIHMFFNLLVYQTGLNSLFEDPGPAKKEAEARLNWTKNMVQLIGKESFYMIPVIGSATESIDSFKAGDYIGGTTAAAFVIVDMASFGESTLAKGFFKGARYSNKVLKQMGKIGDNMHGFPNAIDSYADTYGKTRKFIGGDGKVYEILEIRGMINGKSGTFEYIKNANGEINHRFFNTKK
ncbi:MULTISPECIES: RHS repeat domain-containing protein [unclassified Dysgonomonas]|uniref:RHS repeat domain-containing protein n=1 Tax=unclassified Dysgonomonas TaxID=2630389 RepID=UPI0024730657|nr:MULTISPECIES: RHS repeat-associated core domain-containing protein [unclassified Dysgonomonas]